MKDDRIENVDSPFWKQYEDWEQWKDISHESLHDKLEQMNDNSLQWVKNRNRLSGYKREYYKERAEHLSELKQEGISDDKLLREYQLREKQNAAIREKQIEEFLSKQNQPSGPKPKKPSYQKYLTSETWKHKVEHMKKLFGSKCEYCGSDENICIHHNTYRYYPYEVTSNLTVLCKNCHDQVHVLFKNKNLQKHTDLGDHCMTCGGDKKLEPHLLDSHKRELNICKICSQLMEGKLDHHFKKSKPKKRKKTKLVKKNKPKMILRKRSCLDKKD